MKTAIASAEIYGVAPGGERKRFTVAVGAPARGRHGSGWQCKVTIADVLRPTAIGGADSFEALARAVAHVCRRLAELRDEGWVLSLDRDGREALDVGRWLAPPG